jgi:DNA polymerase I-like protein with 3'-5' exonuclease and polymerase domains
MQNIPIRTDAGMAIRRGFVGSRPASTLKIDYAELELRTLAAMVRRGDGAAELAATLADLVRKRKK